MVQVLFCKYLKKLGFMMSSKCGSHHKRTAFFIMSTLRGAVQFLMFFKLEKAQYDLVIIKNCL